MHAFLDKKYINLVSSQLDRFKWQRQLWLTVAVLSVVIHKRTKTNVVDTSTSVMVDTTTSVTTVVRRCSVSGFLEQVSPALVFRVSLEWIKEKVEVRHPRHSWYHKYWCAQKLAKVNVHRGKLKHVLAIS